MFSFQFIDELLRDIEVSKYNTLCQMCTDVNSFIILRRERASAAWYYDHVPTKEEVLLQVYCMSMGILPIEEVMYRDVRMLLAHLPEAEARKIKRKFRKAWRWAARRREKKGLNFFSSLRQKLWSTKPTKEQMRARKYVVRLEILDRIRKDEKK